MIKKMMTIAVLLICLGVICAANTENSECTNPITCPFGNKGETVRVCPPVASDSAEVCSRFTKCDNCTTTTICSKCPGESEASSSFQGRERSAQGILSENIIQLGIIKSRQKRQFALPDRGPNRGRPTNGFREGPTILSCPTLDGSNLGSLECKRVSSTEETCVGKCWDGYHFDVLNFEEEVTLECRRGVWSPIDAFPDCKRNPTGTLTFCRDPGINSHSVRIPRVPPSHFGFPQGSRLNYSCDPGYNMKGEGGLFCLESGKWSHGRPRCIAKSPTPGDNCVEAKANDCADLLQMGHNVSGVYQVYPMNRLTDGRIIDVYCDMTTSGGGWTVIQRRGTFISGENENFNRDWHDYKVGFGDINKEFWLGNDNIFALTNQKLYSVRFDLKDFEENKAYALYERFWIEEESNNYTLHISGYSGNAGDAMKYHNNYRFSTYDKDNDINEKDNCAMYFQAGWWYYSCLQANLNGLYHKDGKQEPYSSGVNWYYWKSPNVSLAWTEIKIRPRNFSPFALG